MATRSRRRPAAAPKRVAADDRIEVRSPNAPGYSNRVDAVKYEAMRRALFKVLPAAAPGLTQAEMFRAVRPHLATTLFPTPGVSSWWAKTVQLDLEARGLLVREPSKPLRWHRVKRG